MLRRFLKKFQSSRFPGLIVVEGVRPARSPTLIIGQSSPLVAAGSPFAIAVRTFSVSCSDRKSFKHKPERPKLKIHTPEELFGEPKGWMNVPPGGYFLLIIPVSTLLLGIWQVFRWRWKLKVIEEMEKVVRATPMDFPVENLDSLNSMEYTKVKLRGRFEYDNEVLMGPRQLFNYSVDIKPTSSGFMGPGSSPTGYHVITPFRVEGQNFSILVNRGWISDRIIRKYKSTEDNIEIVGVVRKEEKRQPFMPKDDGMTSFHIFRDVTRMADKLKTEHVFIDLESIAGMDLSSARLDNLPVPGQTRVTLRNEHVSYFCTWFSLSAITSYMWHRRFILRKHLR